MDAVVDGVPAITLFVEGRRVRGASKKPTALEGLSDSMCSKFTACPKHLGNKLGEPHPVIVTSGIIGSILGSSYILIILLLQGGGSS